MDEWRRVEQDGATAGIGCQSPTSCKNTSLSFHQGYPVKQLAGSLGEPHNYEIR